MKKGFDDSWISLIMEYVTSFSIMVNGRPKEVSLGIGVWDNEIKDNLYLSLSCVRRLLFVLFVFSFPSTIIIIEINDRASSLE